MQKKYEILDHTADIGLKIYGKNLKQLFQNAALGLFSLISETSCIKSKKKFNINLKAPNIEELLVSWLRELLYIYDAKRMLLCDFKIDKISGGQLEASVSGEPLDIKKHILHMEVKAVTYHQLRVRKTPSGFKAQVIFDV